MLIGAPDDFASSLQLTSVLPRLSARSVTQSAASTGRIDEREHLMRRTVLSALALACTAVLASTVPAFADGTSPTPVPTSAPATDTPSPAPTGGTEVTPSAAPSEGSDEAPTVAPSEGSGQVSVVPSGAPDTGVAPGSSSPSGTESALVGGGAAAVVVGGGAAVLLIRRRRATGA